MTASPPVSLSPSGGPTLVQHRLEAVVNPVSLVFRTVYTAKFTNSKPLRDVLVPRAAPRNADMDDIPVLCSSEALVS